MNLFRISALQLKKQFIIVHVKTLKEVSLTNNKAFKYFFLNTNLILKWGLDLE